MHIPTSFLLLGAFLLPALTAPLPQEGNNQIDEFNVSPTSTLPAATATPSADPLAPAIDSLQPAKKPKIEAQDGMKAGMGAAMSGVGQATSALSSLPIVGSLAGSAGGLGARDTKHKKRLLEVLTSLLGGLGGGGKKVKRGTVDAALYPKIKDMGSAGLVNLGSNNKRAAEAEPQLDILKSLPGVGALLGKAKRQLDALKSLPVLGAVLGGGRKREAAPEPQLDALKGLPIVGGLVGGEKKPPKVKRGEIDGISGIKKVVAEVIDIRGVTSKREAVPEEGDFRQALREANRAKVAGELSSAADKAERKIKIKNTKFPPNGGKVKSPQEALDKREESLEKRGGLDTLPVKDIAESMTGLKSALELLKSANSAIENANGK